MNIQQKLIAAGVILSAMVFFAVIAAPSTASASTSGWFYLNYDNNGGQDPDCALIMNDGYCKAFGDNKGSAGYPDANQLQFCVTAAVKHAAGVSDTAGLNVSYVQVEKQPVSCLAVPNNPEKAGTYITYKVTYSPKETNLTCQEAKEKGLLTAVNGLGGTSVITNRSNQAFTVGFASYKVFDENIDHQVFYAGNYFTISANQTITLTINKPECKYQSDVFCGQILNSFAGGQRYGSRLIDGFTNPSPYCTNGVCSSNSACGTNGYTGSLFCQSGNVYQNYITYTCNNPGTSSSTCSNSTEARLKTTCSTGQTCSNGSCSTVSCNSNSSCGTNGFIGNPFCQGNNVYQNYVTYTCNNPGTSSSTCSNSAEARLKTTCSAGQTCSNGSCMAVSCNCNADCGTSGLTGSPFCQGNSVYQNYITYTCSNPGTSSSTCSNSTTAQLQTTCSGNQTCSGGSCTNINNCTSNYQQRCYGNSLYWYDSCGNQQNLIQYCANGCSGNTCNNNQCNYHSYQRCNGNNLYWYDSCGNQEELAQFCPNGCNGNSCGYNNYNGTLNVTKTVRNLTNGSGFSNSVYASPSDTVMFMITIQANGSQDVQNVFVRDMLPSNLIYNNQLIVACSGNNGYNGNSNCNNYNYNYSGSITSGISLNTIYSGQTVTITYQAQVAGAQNFAYGTTTLNNNVSVTGSQLGYAPSSNASVIVTRAGVLGAATYVSTGLTNNFWVDSFFLPLLATIILLWMWKAGMFFWIEKWLHDKKKIHRGYKAEKELASRVASIQRSGR